MINATGPLASQPRALCWAYMLIIVDCNLPLNPPIWALHDWCLPGGQAYCGTAGIRARTARWAALRGRIPLFSPCDYKTLHCLVLYVCLLDCKLCYISTSDNGIFTITYSEPIKQNIWLYHILYS